MITLKSLNSKHFSELKASKIDTNLIALNFRSLSGTLAWEYLLYSDKLERTNTGRLSLSLLKTYQHLDNGGWWCGGGDDTEWGCFKPNTPRIDREKSKIIKYEHPKGESTEIFMLKVRWGIGFKVAKKHGLSKEYGERFYNYVQSNPNYTVRELLKQQDTDFWLWVENNPSIPIYITEGAKKTACILSRGYVAIGLSGIWNFTDKDILGNKYLKPKIAKLTENRDFIICFDKDKKESTQKQIQSATTQLASILKRHNANKIYVTDWEAKLGKGIDDLEVEKILEVLSNPLDIKAWFKRYLYDFSKYILTQTNSRYCDFDIDLSYKLSALIAAKGTGKTEVLAKEIDKAIRDGKKILCLTHRIQLGRELSNRFGIDYVQELTESSKYFGFALCVDSLKPTGQGKINPDDWENCVVIIDEVDQVLRHLLRSSTCKDDRVKIFETLKDVLDVCDNVIISSADLSTIDIEYFREHLNLDRSEVKVYLNTYRIKKGKAITYSNPNALLNELFRQIDNGKIKHFLQVGSKETKSKFSARNLELKFNTRYPTLRTLVIDADTVKTIGHAAYGCMGHLNELFKDYDIILATPVIETGVSIDECQGYFDGNWVISFGVQSANSFLQAMCRLRDFDCPRHLFFERNVTALKVGNGSVKRETLKLSQEQPYNVICNRLNRDCDNSFEIERKAFISYAILSNDDYLNYCENISQAIKNDGFDLIEFTQNDKESDKQLTQELKANKEYAYELEVEKTNTANDITDSEYEQLAKQTAKTESESYSEKKHKIKKTYGEIDADIIKLNDNGLYSKLNLEFYSTIGLHLLKDRDNTKIDNLSHNNKTFKPDVVKSCLSHKVAMLNGINFSDMAIAGRRFTNKELFDWYESIKPYKEHFNNILGLKLPDRAVASFKQLLGLYGYGTKRIKHRDYTEYEVIDLIGNDRRGRIYDRWLTSATEKFSQSQNVSNYDTKETPKIPLDNNSGVFYTDTTQVAQNDNPYPIGSLYWFRDKVLGLGVVKIIEYVIDGLAKAVGVQLLDGFDSDYGSYRWLSDNDLSNLSPAN